MSENETRASYRAIYTYMCVDVYRKRFFFRRDAFPNAPDRDVEPFRTPFWVYIFFFAVGSYLIYVKEYVTILESGRGCIK